MARSSPSGPGGPFLRSGRSACRSCGRGCRASRSSTAGRPLRPFRRPFRRRRRRSGWASRGPRCRGGPAGSATCIRRFGVEGDDRGGEEVVASDVRRRSSPARRWRSRSRSCSVFGFDRRRVPDAGAAAFVGVVVLRARSRGRFRPATGWCRSATDLAGFASSAVRRPRIAVLAAGAADVEQAVVVERRRGDRVAGAGLDPPGRPFDLAGLLVERRPVRRSAARRRPCRRRARRRGCPSRSR